MIVYREIISADTHFIVYVILRSLLITDQKQMYTIQLLDDDDDDDDIDVNTRFAQ